MREGILFVISAPSGAGKTSLCRELIDNMPDLRHSVSYTTRSARAGEVHGRDYFFVSHQEFRRMVDAGEFAEWAEVHGNLYGTSLATLNEARLNGADLILDIDCQGAAKLRRSFSGGVYIFILPPDFQELRRRLTGRNLDAPEVIERRIANARGEILEAHRYDYIVVNDDFATAAAELRAVFLAERCRTHRVLPRVAGSFELGLPAQETH
ncbi:MAG TPA: guanylate kinase [Verrucomicrobiae bacterium]|nr:guanylate kinase [Verrucomicrobiae bacterium]